MVVLTPLSTYLYKKDFKTLATFNLAKTHGSTSCREKPTSTVLMVRQPTWHIFHNSEQKVTLGCIVDWLAS